ncbi:MAG: SMC family ATPase [archaeon]
MISSARLVNWRSHSDSRFEFTKGTNVLIGIIGSGKSSVMDGISFALFGNFPALQSKKLRLEEVLRDKPEEQDSGYVEVGFNAGGKEYIVRRELKRGRGTLASELRLGGKLIEGPASAAVTKRVGELLKVDYELFSRAVYSEQNQLDYFLKIARGQRMAKLDELLGLDDFEEVRKNSVKLANGLEEKRRAAEEIVKGLEAAGKSKKAELEARLAQLWKLEAGKKAALGKAKDVKAAMEKSARQMEKDFIRFRDMRAKLAVLNKEAERLRALPKGRLSPAELEARLKEAGRERAACRKRLEGAISSIAALESEVGRIAKEVQAAENAAAEFKRISLERPGLDAEIDAKKAEKKKTRERVPRAEGRIEFIEKSLEEFGTNTCPLCETLLDGQRAVALRKGLEEEKAMLSAEISGAKRRLESLEREITFLEGLQEKFEDGKKASERLAKIAPARRKLEEELARLRSRRKGEEKAIGVLEADEETLLRERELAQKRGELERLEREIAGIKREEGDLGFDETEYEKLRKKFDAASDELSLANAEYTSAKARAEEVQAELKRTEGSEKEIEKHRKDAEGITSGIEFLSRFQNALKGTQDELRRRFVDGLNTMMQNIWEGLYPYKDFVGVRLGIEEGDYVLQLEERGGRWVDVEGRVSGGERSSAALVLRMALALGLAPHLRTLILDEPTHNLDKRGIEELAETLRERVAEYIDQVFLITHEEKLEEAVSGSLYRLERDKEGSKPTVVKSVGGLE